MIQVHNLQKHFGTVTGLLGPNGTGKTTSLRMIYGLIRRDARSIQIDASPDQSLGAAK